MTATLPLSGQAGPSLRRGIGLSFCFVPGVAQRGSALRAGAACAPDLRSSRSPRRRFASGSPHARLRRYARLLTRREPHPAPTDGSPFHEWHRRPAPAATRPRFLPWARFRPVRHASRASRPGAIAPSPFALPPPPVTFDAPARCSAPSPKAHGLVLWSKVNAPVTARRPAPGASRHRSLVRHHPLPHRVAPGEASPRSAFARAPLSLPRQPPSMPPYPLRRHTPMVSAPFSSRRSSPRSRNRSLAPSRSDLDRMAGSGSSPASPAPTPASLTGLCTNKIEAQTKKSSAELPERPICVLPSPPDHSHTC